MQDSNVVQLQPHTYDTPDLSKCETPRDYAIAYAKAGLNVFPIRPNRSDPLEGTHAYKDAVANPEDLERMFDKYGDNCNFGFYPGTDFIILDIDMKNGKDGVAAFAKLFEVAGIEMPETYTVQTPTGGFHYYFRYSGSEKLKSPVNLAKQSFGEGIDVRASTGYVVGVGCTRSEGAYTVIKDAPFSEIPEAVLTLIPRVGEDAVTAVRQGAPITEEMQLAMFEVMSNHTLDELKAMLAKLDPNMDRDSWIKAMMAVKTNWRGSGRDIFEEWSAGGASYSKRDFRIAWDSFAFVLLDEEGKHKGIAIGSLIQMGQVAGWEREDSEWEPNERDMTAEAARERRLKRPFERRLTSVFHERSNRKKLPELIRGLLAQNKTIGFVGAGGSGKTVALITMAYSLITGKDFCGCPVHKFDLPDGKLPLVVLIAAEDVDDCDEMWRANLVANGDAQDAYAYQFAVWESSVGLHDAEKVKDLTQCIEDWALEFNLVPVFVGLDSLIRNASPDRSEDKSTDMTLALTNVDRHLRKPLGCSVGVIQHTPHGKNRSRGSTAFFDSVSQELLISGKSESDYVTITCDKWRGGNAKSVRVSAELRVAETGIDADGYTTSSVCLVATNSMSKIIEGDPLTKVALTLFEYDRETDGSTTNLLDTKSLIRMTGIHRDTTINDKLKELEVKGWITRETEKGKGRVKFNHLTDAGREGIDEALKRSVPVGEVMDNE